MAAPLLKRGIDQFDRFDRAFGLVLLLDFTTVVFASLVPFKNWAAVVIAALASLAGMTALMTTKAHPRVIRWAGRVGALCVLAAALGAFTDQQRVLGASLILIAVLLFVGAVAVLRSVVTEERVGFRTILGAVSVYLTLGLLFALVFASDEKIGHRAFFSSGPHHNTGDFIYFSLTTLTTTGYGDFTPAAQPGRLLANIEMLIGQIFLVTLIARLVSMWTPGQWLRADSFPFPEDTEKRE